MARTVTTAATLLSFKLDTRAMASWTVGLIVRTIGIARARVKIGMANLAYNIRRFVWLRTKYAAA